MHPKAVPWGDCRACREHHWSYECQEQFVRRYRGVCITFAFPCPPDARVPLVQKGSGQLYDTCSSH